MQSVELALRWFELIVTEFSVMRFGPAYLGAAKALVILHQHSEALVMARNGLLELPLNRFMNGIAWPGTDKILTDALTPTVEVFSISCVGVV